ncbi:MAG: N-acetylmuramoyl-L-alanine amidase [Succinivibrionaceae bacterium]
MKRIYKNVLLFSVSMVLGFGIYTSSYAANIAFNKDFKIMIDPGHGQVHYGIVSASGIKENKLNIDYAVSLKEKLDKMGFTVSLTHDEEKDVTINERINSAEGYNLFISIHHATVDKKYCTTNDKGHCQADHGKGYTIFVDPDSENFQESWNFAEYIGRSLSMQDYKASNYHGEDLPGEGKQALNEELGIFAYPESKVISKLKMPAIILEVGNVANSEDEKRTTNKKLRDKMQKVIVQSILQYRQNKNDE